MQYSAMLLNFGMMLNCCIYLYFNEASKNGRFFNIFVMALVLACMLNIATGLMFCQIKQLIKKNRVVFATGTYLAYYFGLIIFDMVIDGLHVVGLNHILTGGKDGEGANKCYRRYVKFVALRGFINSD